MLKVDLLHRHYEYTKDPSVFVVVNYPNHQTIHWETIILPSKHPPQRVLSDRLQPPNRENGAPQEVLDVFELMYGGLPNCLVQLRRQKKLNATRHERHHQIVSL